MAQTRGRATPSGSGPTALPDHSPGRARVLSAVASTEAAGRAATITDLAAVLGGHPNTTRAHLGHLVRDGLVQRDGQAVRLPV